MHLLLMQEMTGSSSNPEHPPLLLTEVALSQELNTLLKVEELATGQVRLDTTRLD